MKYYSYFPGCSAEATAAGLGLSVQAIAKPLDIDLAELEDWTCCGSTPYGSLDELESICVAARNLALAEKTGLDLVTACSACYVTLYKANLHLKEHPKLMLQINEALAVANLEYHGNLKVRHLVDVLLNDVTPEVIAAKVQQGLNGLKVAPYYGCQMVRPDYGFDNPEFPQSLDRLVESLGAEVVPYPLKNRCCGGSLIISEESLVLGLIHKLLENAVDNGAQCLATPCPLCQTNLDAYQSKVNSKFKLPVLFISQLIGIALGVNPISLGLNTNIVSPRWVLDNIYKR
ncbi:MAG: CoB--CoM heterodisulfide reductase iron-sulfur subunit B family protein [Dehalococcoidales bacterium]|nr:CoB--CoM heterodisulfide reductase iron-sulfur subunit B family protein [Dehalococcoidales bacterium]